MEQIKNKYKEIDDQIEKEFMEKPIPEGLDRATAD